MALRFSRTTAIREERERKRLQRKERIIRQMSFGKKKTGKQDERILSYTGLSL